MTHENLPLDSGDGRIDWARLARYVAGESPEPEARAVAEWLAAHPAYAQVLAALDHAIGTLAATPATLGAVAEVDVEAALHRVKARRGGPDVLPLRRPAPVPRQPAAGAGRRWRAAALAAAAAALVAVGVTRWPDREAAGELAAVAAARTVITPVGALDSLRLPNGSRVLLAPGSRLVIAAGYGATRREVTLEGGAWFDVRRDDTRPFIVRAAGAVVRDVGTAFTVRTDAMDGVAVAVTEGVVALRAATDAVPGAAARDTAVVLAAGDRGASRSRACST